MTISEELRIMAMSPRKAIGLMSNEAYFAVREFSLWPLGPIDDDVLCLLYLFVAEALESGVDGELVITHWIAQVNTED